ncbi:MAG: alanine racemase [Oscillospiraceae bacterium]|jgi:alanine racemase
MQKFHKRTWAEIHLDRLERNFNTLKSFLGDKTQPVAVVKANAYGHGDEAVAPFLEKIGVKWFAVSNISEALRLRTIGIKGEILVLGYGFPEDVANAVSNNIILTVTGIEHAQTLSKKIPAEKKLRIHIKIDTGMGRIGVLCSSIQACANEIEKICKIDNLSAEGIFTHLSAADSSEKSDIAYTSCQIERFLAVENELESKGIRLLHRHYLNSAGSVYHSGDKSTLSRLGIMLYGLYPNHSLELPCPLEPVMDFKTTITQVKIIKAGDFVSYGRTYIAEKDTQIASMAVGYADGYSRLLSSIGEVLINGKRAKIAGRVCMDQTMLDVTGITVKSGDTVTLFGSSEDDLITADDLADLYGTIGYEIICGISKRVPRVIFYNGEIINVLNYLNFKA